jgi:integrase
MASLTKHPKSKYWTACFVNRDGRQMKRSTKTTNKATALQIALEIERVEKQAKQGALTTTHLRKVLNDVSEKITGDNLSTPSVEDYLNDWLAGIRARNKKGTLDRYGNTVKVFLANLEGKAKKPITGITSMDIETFLNARLKSGAAPKTAIVDVKTLNSAFRRAEAYGIILKNPVMAVQLPKGNSSERDLFTNDEVQRLLAAAPTIDWQTLILLGYFVGARLSDCVQMKWENIRPEEGLIVYHQQKTGKKVTVPMHYHVIEHLNYLSTFGTDGFLCPKLAGKGSGGKHGLSEGFKRVILKAGIDPKTARGKGTRNFSKRTFHSLRHGFSSALANAGVSEEIRMKLTGHSSKAIHSQYTHLEVQTLKTAMTTLPLFGPKAGPSDVG